MMNKSTYSWLFFVVVLFCTTSLVFSYTTPGTGVVWSGEELVEFSDGVVAWDADNLRYEVIEELIIASGDSIFISSTMNFTNNGTPDIRVQGRLTIFTPAGQEDSVAVLGNDDDGPGGIRVEDGGRSYLTDILLIGGGEEGNDDGIRVLSDSYIEATGCRIGDWNHYAIGFSGADGLVENCVIHDSYQWAINITLGSNPVIRNTTLIRNNLQNTGAKNPISIGVQGSNNPVIEDCHIIGQPNNRHGGISAWTFGTPCEVTVRRTRIENCSYGIVASGDGMQVLVTDCELLNNTAMDDPMNYGSGINVNGSARVGASRNIISGNSWGVTTITNGRANLGDFDNINPDLQGHNQIFENGNNGEVYNLYNNTNFPMLAQNNYWGTMNEQEVEDGIFHNPDNPQLGLVDYLPLWEPGNGEFTQTYELNGNYFSMISLNLVPENLNAMELFGEIPNVVIVYDVNGGFVIPELGLNTIGEIDLTRGYLLFCNEATTFELTGEPLEMENTVYHVSSGRWDWFGNPLQQPVDNTIAWAGMDADIAIVIDAEGNSWIPALDINLIGDVLPGEGYRIYAYEDFDFVYQGGEVLASIPDDYEAENRTTIKNLPRETGLPYVVVISMDKELQSKARIVELYDGELMVGKGLAEKGSKYLPVTAWGGDIENNLQGFMNGNRIEIRLLDETGKSVEFKTQSTGIFGKAPYSVLHLESVSLPEKFAMGTAYPNPFNPGVSIPVTLPEKGELRFIVFDLLGRELFKTSMLYEAGIYEIYLSTAELGNTIASGVYIVQAEFNSKIQRRKITLLK